MIEISRSFFHQFQLALKRSFPPRSGPQRQLWVVIAVVVGTILYPALGFVFHPIVIGVPAFATVAPGH